MRKTFLIDLAERTAATYGQALCGLLLADATHMLSLGAVRAAAVAALPAALAIVKGALGGAVTGGSAAWLPPEGSAAAPATPAPAAGPAQSGV
jgi:hypothetical protein